MLDKQFDPKPGQPQAPAQVPENPLAEAQFKRPAEVKWSGHDRVLFRGSFNPIHEGHLDVIKQLLERGYKTVIVSPVGTSPGKGTIPTSVEVRSEMILALLKAEGVPIADTHNDPGVYVVPTRKEGRKLLRQALLSKTDFAMGADNDVTYGKHKSWRLLKAFGEDRLAIVHGSRPVHSSHIRKGLTEPHPALKPIIAEYKLYQDPLAAGLSRFKNILVVFNPISGPGESEKKATALAEKLRTYGLNVDLRASSARYAKGELEGAFAKRDLILAVCGDGTAMGMLGGLSATGAPFYMLHGGNEAIITKLFGMKREIPEALEDLSKRTAKEHYYGLVNGQPFFLMMTIGFDAMVLEKIGERKGPSSDWMYVKAGLKTIVSYRTPRISLTVDGKQVVNNERGYLIIGNTDGYGKNLKLTPEAKSSEPLLYARFFPQRGLAAELSKAIRMAFEKPANLKGSRAYSGEKFELQIHNAPYPLHADGELLGSFAADPIIIETSKNPIRVLEE